MCLFSFRPSEEEGGKPGIIDVLYGVVSADVRAEYLYAKIVSSFELCRDRYE